MSTLKNIITVVQEDILGSDNRFIAWTWVAGVVGIIFMGLYLSSETVSFLGVAGSRESQVNFEYPVEIR
ncbi:MAG: hypothetical protein AB7H97_03730, partial [Pseudobdellovibrionaceae bacterium]